MSGQYFRQNLRQMITHIIPYLARFFKGINDFLTKSFPMKIKFNDYFANFIFSLIVQEKYSKLQLSYFILACFS